MLHKAAVSITALLFILSSSLRAQQAGQETNRFRIRVSSRISGSEEYKITRTAEGFLLTGKSHLQVAGREMDLAQEQTLAPDMSLRRYKLEVTSGTGPQWIEAWHEGDTLQMKVTAGGKETTRKVPFAREIFVLDNLITAHFQVLLNRLGAKPPAASSWTFLVPQVVDTVAGKVVLEGKEAGTLEGHPVTLDKYALEVPGLLEYFWAEAGTHRLMQVSVPVQKVELVREGFVLAPKAEPGQEAAAFVERSLEFPSGSLKFPATLCLPASAAGKKLPIIILVHGSGPQDRDETIGPNKPFRDLAHGLAAAGIATLRYDKRTYAFRQQLDPKTMTVEEETIADAVAASEFARTLPEVDGGSVFVLGHSQGAMFAPAIAQRAHARGAVLMAAAERPMDQVIEDQIAFQLRQAGKSDQEITGETGKLKTDFARIRSGEAGDAEMVFFAPAHYWRDFLRRDTLAELKKLEAPVLLLQGGKDIQILKADYDLAQQALAGKPPGMREAHWFPNLNHLFLPVEGVPTGAEYGRAASVAPEVIQTIAAWVHQQSAAK